MSNVGCEQDVPMAHVRKLQFADTGYETHVGSTICPKQTVSYGENPVRRLESAEKTL
jgi:hypothetical protein